MTSKKILIILTSSLLLFISTMILVLNHTNFIKSIDSNTALWINSIHFPALNDFMLSITKVGNVYESFLIFIVFSILLIVKRKKISFYIFTVSTVLGVILPEIIKNLTERIRPIGFAFQESGFSFPSGHATISTILLISSFILIAPTIKNNLSRIIFLVVSTIVFVSVAFSRIYLSVHFTSDVIAGILLGVSCFCFSQLVCCHKK
jgi:undecaprenyl-diphosphatase